MPDVHPATRDGETIVLVDDEGHATGVTDAASGHHLETPRHLGAAVYVIGPDEQLLLIRRAATRAWPQLWDQSAHSHPGPGEPIGAAIRRVLAADLDVVPHTLNAVLPQFRFHTTEPSAGIRENEISPVFLAHTTSTQLRPDPARISDYLWLPWSHLRRRADADPSSLAPWVRAQVRLLRRLPGGSPFAWASSPASALPPAALRSHRLRSGP